MIQLLNNNAEIVDEDGIISRDALSSVIVNADMYNPKTIEITMKKPEGWVTFADRIEYVRVSDPYISNLIHIMKVDVTSGKAANTIDITGTDIFHDMLKVAPPISKLEKGSTYTLSEAMNLIVDGLEYNIAGIESDFNDFVYTVGDTDETNVARADFLSTIQEYFGFWLDTVVYYIDGVYDNRLYVRRRDLGFKGKRAEYGINIQDAEYTMNYGEVITALVATGADVKTEYEDEWGHIKNDAEPETVTIENIEWSVANGDPVDKPLGQKYIEIPKLTARHGYKGKPRFAVYNNTECVTPSDLINKAYKELVDMYDNIEIVSATVTDLDHGNNFVQLGERIRVVLPRLIKTVSVDLPATQASYDLLSKYNNSYTVGKHKVKSLADLVKRVAQKAVAKTSEDVAVLKDKAVRTQSKLEAADDNAEVARHKIEKEPIDTINNTPEKGKKKIHRDLLDLPDGGGGEGWDYTIHADDEDKTPYMTFKGDSNEGKMIVKLNSDTQDDDKTKPDKNKPLFIRGADDGNYIELANFGNTKGKYIRSHVDTRVNDILRVGLGSESTNRVIKITNRNAKGGTQFAVAGAQTTGTGYAKTETPFAVNGFRYDADYNTEYSRMLYITPKRFSVNGIDLGKFPNQSASQYYLAPNIDITAGNHVNNLTMAMAQLYGKYSLMLGTDLEKTSGIPKNLLMYLNGSDFKVASTSTSLYLGGYTANSEEVEGDGRITFKNDDTHYVSFARVDRKSGDAKTEVAIVGAPTTSTAANVTINNNNVLCKVSSSKRYKQDLEPVTLEAAEKLLDVQAMTWYDKAEVAGNNGSTEGLRRYPGLIAEHLHEAGLQELVEYNADGEVESILYDRIPAHMLVLLQKVVKDTESMEKRIDKQQSEIELLKEQVKLLMDKVGLV